MAELALGVLVVCALFIADPERLQLVIEKLREFAAWLAE